MEGYQPANVVPFTAPAGGVTAETGVKIGDVFVVARETAAVGVQFNGQRTGKVRHAKLAAQAWTEGQQINWDNTAKLMTTVTTGNFKVGVAAAVAANPSGTGYVILHGGNLGAALA